MLASFWSMPPGGTWPVMSVVFGIVVICLLIKAYIDYKHRKDPTHVHYHKDEKGIAHACYHACKNQNLFFSKMYWVSLTFAFPIEHIVYHKLWPFYLLSNWLNIS